jgi:Kef-type K+ transport system membrane component KefB
MKQIFRAILIVFFIGCVVVTINDLFAQSFGLSLNPLQWQQQDVSETLRAQAEDGPLSTDPAPEEVADEESEVLPDPSEVYEEEGHSAGHSDPFSYILIELAVIILAAVAGRSVAQKFNQPGVLGELLVGVIVGNLFYWLGFPLFNVIMNLEGVQQVFNLVVSQDQSLAEAVNIAFADDPKAAASIQAVFGQENSYQILLAAIALWIFSKLGVIVLLLMVGMGSSVGQILGVGKRAMGVAIIGVVVPVALGVGSSMLLISDARDGMNTHLFMGAALAATSVGITARVFRDLGKLNSKEGQTILGAAVIDDVLGLIILAVVIGIVQTGQFDPVTIVRISVLATVFLGGLVLYGDRGIRALNRWTSKLGENEFRLLLPLIIAFGLAWAASLIDLEPIIGAFAAGLILKNEYFDERTGQTAMGIQQRIAPLENVFAPVFFVLIGMQVNLSTFADVNVLVLAVLLTIIAIAGKVVAGAAAGKDIDRLSVGVGMVPRGEVGLIFANIGKSMGVMSSGTFSAVVIMVILTTMVAPPALKWTLARSGKRHTEAEDKVVPDSDLDSTVETSVGTLIEPSQEEDESSK